MDDKIKATIAKIQSLAQQNPEFDQAMRKLFGKAVPADGVSIPNEVSDDVKAIREALEIRATNSITYDFVKQQRLRDQLIIDNLRMENAALNLQQNEDERFYTFCVNAFYQLENIINYYFHITFPSIEVLVEVIERFTEQEDKGFRYKSDGKEINVGNIPVAHKINAICNMLMPEDKTLKWALGTLRQVRNEGAHRCMVIQQEKDESNNLYRFFKRNTFNSVRILLIRVIRAIQSNIGVNPFVVKKATIVNIFPGACYVEFDGETKAIPEKLVPKTKGKQIKDEINLLLLYGAVLDVKP